MQSQGEKTKPKQPLQKMQQFKPGATLPPNVEPWTAKDAGHDRIELAAIQTYLDFAYQEQIERFTKEACLLIAEIMRGEVNAQDECEKFLRTFAPKVLAAHFIPNMKEWRERSRALHAAIDEMPRWMQWACLLRQWRKFRTAAAYNRVACHLLNSEALDNGNGKLGTELASRGVDLWAEIYGQNVEVSCAGNEKGKNEHCGK